MKIYRAIGAGLFLVFYHCCTLAMMDDGPEEAASSSPPSSRAIPPQSIPDETFTEKVGQNPDPRHCVSPSALSKFPYTTVGFLDIMWQTQDRTRATIFLISQQWALTAAHAVLDYTLGKKPLKDNLTAYFCYEAAADGSGGTHYEAIIKGIQIHPSYVDGEGKKNRKYDWALLGVTFSSLDAGSLSTVLGGIPGILYSDRKNVKSIQKKRAIIFGYPDKRIIEYSLPDKTKAYCLTDIPQFKLMEDRGELVDTKIPIFAPEEDMISAALESDEGYYVRYTMNTTEGQSGSPIWLYLGSEETQENVDEWFIVGMHTLGGVSTMDNDYKHNYGLLFTEEVRSFIESHVEK